MEDRTERIESTPTTTSREVRTEYQPSSQVRRPAAAVEHVDAVAYDPYANKRLAAFRVTQTIYWVFGLIEGLIAIRFVLKALGANPSAGFAQFLYSVTYPLVQPFIGLFGSPTAQGSVLELQSIVALVVYALLAWLLTRLAWILVGDTRSATRTHTTEVDSRV